MTQQPIVKGYIVSMHNVWFIKLEVQSRLIYTGALTFPGHYVWRYNYDELLPSVDSISCWETVLCRCLGSPRPSVHSVPAQRKRDSPMSSLWVQIHLMLPSSLALSGKVFQQPVESQGFPTSSGYSFLSQMLLSYPKKWTKSIVDTYVARCTKETAVGFRQRWWIQS